MAVSSSLPRSTLEALESLNLPTPPAAALAFLRAASRDDASIGELTELAHREPSLAVRILSAANAAAFRGAGELSSLSHSMQVLGLRALHNIAASIAVREAFSGWSGAGGGSLDGFWRHALEMALFSQAIAAETGAASPEEAYLAGLLHDVGELLLLGGLGEAYGRLLNAAAGSETALLALERADLQTDHAAVGAWLVDCWRLPSFTADALLQHHLGIEELRGADGLSRVLWAAHHATAAGHEADLAAQGGAAELVGVAAERLLALRDATRQRAAEVAATLGIAAGADPLPQVPLAPPAATARVQLHEAVGAMAVLQPLQRDLGDIESPVDLLAQACESARILFGVGDVVFLQADDGPPAYRVLPLPGQGAHLAGLRFDAGPAAGGAVARAVRSGHLAGTFDDEAGSPPTVAERQLARALGAPGLLCVPMATGPVVDGLMVLPVQRLQHAALAQRHPMLEAFGSLLATQLLDWRRWREREQSRTSTALDEFRARERRAAHEVGNPLGIIRSYLLILRRRLPENAALDAEMKVLDEEIDRVARIVGQLAAVETPGDAGAKAALDLNALVVDLRSLYAQPLFGARGLTLSLDLQRPLAPALASRDAVRQLLLNLWKNAAEALPAGAHVTVATLDPVYRGGRAYVQVSVSDNGPGLPADVRAALFQPLAPGRRAGHAGLGLSIVHDLVRQQGGEIECRTQPDRGTQFTVLLPQDAP